MEPPREREHEGHDVGADVVVEDLAKIGDDGRVRDQLVVIEAGGRRGLRRLQPAELVGARQERRRDPPKGALGHPDRLLGAFHCLGRDDFEFDAASASRRPIRGSARSAACGSIRKSRRHGRASCTKRRAEQRKKRIPPWLSTSLTSQPRMRFAFPPGTDLRRSVEFCSGGTPLNGRTIVAALSLPIRRIIAPIFRTRQCRPKTPCDHPSAQPRLGRRSAARFFTDDHAAINLQIQRH